MSRNQPPMTGYIPKKKALHERHQRPLPKTRKEIAAMIERQKTRDQGPAIIRAAIAAGIGITFPELKERNQ